MIAKKILWTAADVIDATDGNGEGHWEATGVSIDSRTVSKGDLFVAIKGANFDGHDYVQDALKKGAVAALVEYVPANFTRKNGHLVEVEDTMVALRKLAQHRRAACKGKIIAVTGSVGKTTVKESIALLLSTFGKTHVSKGNFNNHIGLPLSLAQMPVETEYGVFEMGMNHAGEITPLVKIARPHISVITAVEAVHIEFFDSLAGIAKAKAEIFNHMADSSVAVIPTATEHHDILEKAARSNGIKTIYHTGSGPKANYRLVGRQEAVDGQEISANIEGKYVRYELPLLGKHHAANSLTILATMRACGFEIHQIVPLLSDLRLPEGRGAIQEVELKLGKSKVLHFHLIDDSYNASPVAMKAALEVLAHYKKHKGGRTVAILGDMLELGDEAPALHSALAGDINECGVDKVYVAGTLMQHLYKALPPAVAAHNAEEPMALLPHLLKELKNGDIVLMKGSHGSHVHALASAIKKGEVKIPKNIANDE